MRDGYESGNKARLSVDEQFILEQRVLPEARRWVRDIPALAQHGRATLEYWGESMEVAQ